MRNKTSIPTIAIVGRPNVGKSSLFNVIIGRRMAIVHEQKGVTRDRIAATVIKENKYFQLLDTGGLGYFSDETKKLDMWDAGIRKQVDIAIEGADIIIFMTDTSEGVVPLDYEIATKLRACGKKIFCVPNKADTTKLETKAMEFSDLGFDNIYPIATLHRRGIHDLLDELLVEIPLNDDVPSKTNPFKISVLGRPNVGKSSIVNALLDEERVMVSDVPGTTRDSIDVPFEIKYHNEKLPVTLVDTAGIRKRSKVDNAIETFSIMRAESAIKRSDLVLFVVEANGAGLTAQDKRIAKMIAEHNTACIIVANKWDMCEEKNKQSVIDEIRYTLPRMTYAPVVFTCALTKYSLTRILDTAVDVMENMEIKVSTPVLNNVLEEAFVKNASPVGGRQQFKIYYGTMIKNAPPTFKLFVNNASICTKSYLAYISNYIRKKFVFTGLPIVIELNSRKKKEHFINKDKSGQAKSYKKNVRKKTHRKPKRKIRKH